MLPQLAPEVEPLYRVVLDTGRPLINREVSGPPTAAPSDMRHWLDSYYPVAAPGAPPIGVGVIVVDITDIKRTSAALRETEQKLAMLVDVLPIGISILDRADRIAFANPALERITGMSHAQLLAGGYQGRRYLQADGAPMAAAALASARAPSSGPSTMSKPVWSTTTAA